MRILVVEDNSDLRLLLQRRLEQENYSVDVCDNGQDAQEFISCASYDCVVLDIMLPKLSGIEVLSAMRTRRDLTPVLLLTARDSIADRVKGLDAGADDYLVKPFSYDELSARVRALMRRGSEEKSNELCVGDLCMDILAQRVRRADKQIELTSKEYALLEYMMRNPNRVLTRGQIIEHVWNFDYDNSSNVVDVYIRYLRRKIDEGQDVKLIHTARGSGYMLGEKE